MPVIVEDHDKSEDTTTTTSATSEVKLDKAIAGVEAAIDNVLAARSSISPSPRADNLSPSPRVTTSLEVFDVSETVYIPAAHDDFVQEASASSSEEEEESEDENAAHGVDPNFEVKTYSMVPGYHVANGNGNTIEAATANNEDAASNSGEESCGSNEITVIERKADAPEAPEAGQPTNGTNEVAEEAFEKSDEKGKESKDIDVDKIDGIPEVQDCENTVKDKTKTSDPNCSEANDSTDNIPSREEAEKAANNFDDCKDDNNVTDDGQLEQEQENADTRGGVFMTEIGACDNNSPVVNESSVNEGNEVISAVASIDDANAEQTKFSEGPKQEPAEGTEEVKCRVTPEEVPAHEEIKREVTAEGTSESDVPAQVNPDVQGALRIEVTYAESEVIEETLVETSAENEVIEETPTNQTAVPWEEGNKVAITEPESSPEEPSEIQDISEETSEVTTEVIAEITQVPEANHPDNVNDQARDWELPEVSAEATVEEQTEVPSIIKIPPEVLTEAYAIFQDALKKSVEECQDDKEAKKVELQPEMPSDTTANESTEAASDVLKSNNEETSTEEQKNKDATTDQKCPESLPSQEAPEPEAAIIEAAETVEFHKKEEAMSFETKPEVSQLNQEPVVVEESIEADIEVKETEAVANQNQEPQDLEASTTSVSDGQEEVNADTETPENKLPSEEEVKIEPTTNEELPTVGQADDNQIEDMNQELKVATDDDVNANPVVEAIESPEEQGSSDLTEVIQDEPPTVENGEEQFEEEKNDQVCSAEDNKDQAEQQTDEVPASIEIVQPEVEECENLSQSNQELEKCQEVPPAPESMVSITKDQDYENPVTDEKAPEPTLETTIEEQHQDEVKGLESEEAVPLDETEQSTLASKDECSESSDKVIIEKYQEGEIKEGQAEGEADPEVTDQPTEQSSPPQNDHAVPEEDILEHKESTIDEHRQDNQIEVTNPDLKLVTCSETNSEAADIIQSNNDIDEIAIETAEPSPPPPQQTEEEIAPASEALRPNSLTENGGATAVDNNKIKQVEDEKPEAEMVAASIPLIKAVSHHGNADLDQRPQICTPQPSMATRKPVTVNQQNSADPFVCVGVLFFVLLMYFYL